MSASLCRAALSAAVSLACLSGVFVAPTHAQSTEELLAEFQRYTGGTRLVFRAADLPDDGYHDIMIPLSASGRQRAAQICLREVRKYPPGFLGRMGLRAIGIFAGCASREGDGYREYDEQLGGYRYYGIWNGRSGIAGAFYSEDQLPLTFHHEIFHHIDGTQGGVCDASRFFTSDDRQFTLAVAGQQRYAALRIPANDLAALRRVSQGNVLEDTVSGYASKAYGEDQAETARHFMTSLPDALVQMVERPELPGSQRLLHCLTQYQQAAPNGPGVAWFVGVALGRSAEAAPAPAPTPALVGGFDGANSVLVNPASPRTGSPARVGAPPVGPLRLGAGGAAPNSPGPVFPGPIASAPVTPGPVTEPAAATPLPAGPIAAGAIGAGAGAPGAAQLIAQLQQFAQRGQSGWDGVAEREDDARRLIVEATNIERGSLTPEQGQQLFAAAADVTHQLLRCRLQASDQAQRFAIRGQEDAQGINWALREDVAAFGADAQRLKMLAAVAPEHDETLARVQMENLRLVSQYYAYIANKWNVSEGTQEVFDATRDAIADGLPAAQSSLATQIRQTRLDELAVRLPGEGVPKLLDSPYGVAPAANFREFPPEGERPAIRENKYMENIDREISDEGARMALRRVQPACVRFTGASGCCLTPNGTILTAAHVADALGKRMRVMFPDGKVYNGTCTAYDENFDLALVQLENARNLPIAPLAPAPPEVGQWVCAIGQPGSTTPEGGSTGYGAFHVSTGQIRGFKRDRLGHQMLGGTKHDAWTYWGHSGCPLFDQQGSIIAMHNSWDSNTGMRHGVTYEAIVQFLNKNGVKYAVAR